MRTSPRWFFVREWISGVNVNGASRRSAGGTAVAPGKYSMREAFPRRYGAPLCVAFSALLLGFGVFMPVLTVEQLIMGKRTFSVLSGIGSLYEEGHLALAAVIAAFSVVFPIGKSAALFGVWYGGWTHERRRFLLHGLAFLGKWSMLDVFVVAVIVVAVKMGSWMNAEPRIGIYLFGSSILLSMAATARIGHLSVRALERTIAGAGDQAGGSAPPVRERGGEGAEK